MWEHEIIESEDTDFGPDEPIEYEKLEVGAFVDLEIIHESDGRFFVQAVDDCNGEINIGTADDLESAKLMAERWALAQIAEMLKSLGAAGIWMLRGTEWAELFYSTHPGGDMEFSVALEPPHPRLMLIRFPAGDGEPEGIEYF
jgi:hypothetical protein